MLIVLIAGKQSAGKQSADGSAGLDRVLMLTSLAMYSAFLSAFCNTL